MATARRALPAVLAALMLGGSGGACAGDRAENDLVDGNVARDGLALQDAVFDTA